MANGIGSVWAANYGEDGKPNGVGSVWIENASALVPSGGAGDEEVNTLVHTNSGTWNKVTNKLDTSSFSDVSGSFLTAHQDLSNYVETPLLSGSNTLIRDSYIDDQTGDLVYTGPYQVSNSAWVKYPQGPLSAAGVWGSPYYFWNNIAMSASYVEATLYGEFAAQYWPTACNDQGGNERFYLLTAVDDGENSSATYTATFSTEGTVGYWANNLAMDVGEVGYYVTNAEGSIRKYEPSGIKELALKEDVPQIQFVATSAEATGTNILYVVTGSN